MCTNNKKQVHFKTFEEASYEFVSNLTYDDTTTVLKLGTEIMELLKKNKVDNALDLLYMVKDHQLYRLDTNKRESLKNRFNMFPVLDYKYENMSFASQGMNDVKYTVTFLTECAKNTSRNIVLMFNPIKIDGNWYFTVKEKGQLSSDTEEKVHPQSFAPKEITLHSEIQ